jgi:hypothetical protein
MSFRRRGPRDRAEAMRDEMVMRDRILALVTDVPKTIPAIAEAVGAPTAEVVMWVMAMRRYGLIEEEGRADDEGYFAYAPKKGGAA